MSSTTGSGRTPLKVRTIMRASDGANGVAGSTRLSSNDAPGKAAGGRLLAYPSDERLNLTLARRRLPGGPEPAGSLPMIQEHNRGGELSARLLFRRNSRLPGAHHRKSP